jgi:hypothetical protein
VYPALFVVADTDVEAAVGADLQLAAVVVCVVLLDQEQSSCRVRVRPPVAGAVLDDVHVAVPVRVVDVETPARRVVGRKSH